eukprot:NODE_256_length_12667_cov_0.196292.p8 type:complete len:119 gc:universal NODE_256_length_12667_cov_0.196292:9582-9938(+)
MSVASSNITIPSFEFTPSCSAINLFLNTAIFIKSQVILQFRLVCIALPIPSITTKSASLDSITSLSFILFKFKQGENSPVAITFKCPFSHEVLISSSTAPMSNRISFSSAAYIILKLR